MSVISGIRRIFGKKEAEATLDTYACFPVFQMLERKVPFNDWRWPDTNIPTGLEEFFQGCVWMYQLYWFYILTAQRYGDEIADNVIRIQVDALSKVSVELGNQHETGIRHIQNTIVSLLNKPYVPEVEGKRIEMPTEYMLAIDFLVTGKEAPFHVEREQVSGGNVPKMKDAPLALAECLAHGKLSARKYFSTVIETVRIVL
jgi:hypothetical protein